MAFLPPVLKAGVSREDERGRHLAYTSPLLSNKFLVIFKKIFKINIHNFYLNYKLLKIIVTADYVKRFCLANFSLQVKNEDTKVEGLF